MTSAWVQRSGAIAVVFALATCSGNDSGATSTPFELNSSASTPRPAPSATLDETTATSSHTLDLPEGTGEPATFEFDAPVPIENTFDVEIIMPIGTELDIKFLTSNGMTLMIFDSDGLETWCVEDDGRLVCQLPPPLWRRRPPGHGWQRSTRSPHRRPR
ncbi:MAG TPA: hypothetical protein VE569_03785 [Acidimicrobiia bacterium]|nr:hypothetical protein [Acidimicrobiia bacterium]